VKEDYGMTFRSNLFLQGFNGCQVKQIIVTGY
jgi:hypothetical protein